MRKLFSCFEEQAFHKPGLRPNDAEISPAAGLVAAWSAAQIGMLLMAIVFRVVR